MLILTLKLKLPQKIYEFQIEDKYLVKEEDKIKILSFITNDGFQENLKKEILRVFILIISFFQCLKIQRRVLLQEKIRIRFYENEKKN